MKHRRRSTLAGRIGYVLLPLVGIGAGGRLWAIASATWCARPAVAAARPGRRASSTSSSRSRSAASWTRASCGSPGTRCCASPRATRSALLIGTPLGFLLGRVEAVHARCFDPIIQILRPVSPLAWLPLGLVLFQKSEPAALFTIAMCSMWPTVLNTALGVRAIPQDYLERRAVLQLSRAKTLFKIMLPAALPYMFTGFRLSLGIAWLVIVAAEMLTGAPGVGGFLWQEYNSLIYEHIILCILTIGLVGFVLDRLMSMVEARGCRAGVSVERRWRVARAVETASARSYGDRRDGAPRCCATST